MRFHHAGAEAKKAAQEPDQSELELDDAAELPSEANAVRHPSSRSFSRSFQVAPPGIAIKERLRVPLPNDTD